MNSVCFFNSDLLKSKLKAIADIQNDKNYLQKKAEENDRIEKARKLEKERIHTNYREKKAIEKRVREIALARQIKRLDEVDLENNTPKKHEKQLHKRQIDLSDKIPVRIDRNTTVYVNPGTDIEAIKIKYRPKPIESDEYLKPKKRVKEKEQIDNKELRRLVKMNTPVKTIANLLNVRPASVKKVIKYLGI